MTPGMASRVSSLALISAERNAVAFRGRLDDQLANFCRAGKSDLVNPWMGRQWRTRLFTETSADIHHPVGESRFLDKLTKKQSG